MKQMVVCIRKRLCLGYLAIILFSSWLKRLFTPLWREMIPVRLVKCKYEVDS